MVLWAIIKFQENKGVPDLSDEEKDTQPTDTQPHSPPDPTPASPEGSSPENEQAIGRVSTEKLAAE
jgi:hypothetical protein